MGLIGHTGLIGQSVGPSGLPGPTVIVVPDADRLLTTGEAAKLLGIGRRTLSRYAEQGRLTPAVTIPGLGRVTYKWDPDALRKQWRELRRG
jgi:excisionase family DNA binding protein